MTKMKRFNHSQPGFSLIELLLIISFIVILSVTAIYFSSNFLVRSNYKNKISELTAVLRTAQLNTVSGKENSQWGVHVNGTKIIMFKGASYVSPGTSFNQTYDIPNGITVTNAEIVFGKLTGNPNTTGIFTVTNNLGESTAVSINAVGTVDVN